MKEKLKKTKEEFIEKVKDLHYKEDILNVINLEVNFMRGKVRKEEANHKRILEYKSEILEISERIEDLYKEYAQNDGDMHDFEEILNEYEITDINVFVAELLSKINNILE